MNRRGPHILITLVFGTLLLTAGAHQFAWELHHGHIPQALSLFARVPSVANLRAYEDRLENESQLAAWLRPWMQYVRFILLNDPGEKAVRGHDGWFFYRPGLEYLTQRMPLDPAQADPVQAICDFRDQLASRGIRLIVLPAPNKESIYPERLTRRADPLSVAVGTTTRSVLRRLQNAGVEVVDLFEIFNQARKQPPDLHDSHLYLVQDSHWSPRGVELAAQAVAKRLIERGWIECGNKEYQVRSTFSERLGDVVRMLNVRRMEARLRPELLVSKQVIDPDTGETYRDDPESEILVLGDSFLRIYQHDEPGAAGFIAHLARELRQPVAAIVNDGGASTLVRQELYRRPALLANKRVVVWEFVERDIRLGLQGWQFVPLPPTPH